MVTVPFQENVRKLAKLIKGLGDRDGRGVEWDIKKFKTVKP
jgi:hypothetical protein